MQNLVSKIRQFLTHDLWSFDAGALPTFRASFLWLSRILFISVRGFRRDRCMFHASALTYITVLSLVPVLAFMFSMAKGLGAYDTLVADVIQPSLDQLFPVVTSQAGEVTGSGAVALESGTSSVRDTISTILDFVANTDASKLGLFGLAVLLWAVVKLLGSVEQSFNEIWGVSSSRTLVRKVSDYLAIVVIAPIFMLTATAITASAQSTWVTDFLSEKLHLGPLLDFLLGVLPLVAIWGGFTFIYMCLPNKRVRFISALVGGIGGGTIWHLLMVAYFSLQASTANFNALYAGFAAIPILLVWICLSWVTVLFGAELAAAYSKAPTYRGSADTGPVEKGFEEVMALRMLTHVAKRFIAGDAAWTIESLSERMHLPEMWLEDIVDQLVVGKVLIRVGDERVDTIQPARALETISIVDVQRALRGGRQTERFAARDQADHRVLDLLAKMDEERVDSERNHSLRDLGEEAIRDAE
ncbi:MAG: membrane protein, partial [Planctomycetota bacterium]